jgi:hypothetical protein
MRNLHSLALQDDDELMRRLTMMTIASRVLASNLLAAAAFAVLGITAAQPGHFARVLSFGDSIIDNGNWLRYSAGSPGNVANLPYGETFFGRPNGRFCDGRVIIDNIGASRSSKCFHTGPKLADFFVQYQRRPLPCCVS